MTLFIFSDPPDPFLITTLSKYNTFSKQCQ
jgi:hypothetical protein